MRMWWLFPLGFITVFLLVTVYVWPMFPFWLLIAALTSLGAMVLLLRLTAQLELGRKD